jgi:hypothetical protein
MGANVDNNVKEIRALNDLARASFLGCHVLLRAGISAIDDLETFRKM